MIKLSDSLTFTRKHTYNKFGSFSRHKKGKTFGKKDDPSNNGLFCKHHDKFTSHSSENCHKLRSPIKGVKCFYAHHEYKQGHSCRASKGARAEKCAKGELPPPRFSSSCDSNNYKVNTMKQNHNDMDLSDNATHLADAALNNLEASRPTQTSYSYNV